MNYEKNNLLTGSAIALAVAGLAACSDSSGTNSVSSAAAAATDTATTAVKEAANETAAAAETAVASADSGSVELGHCYGANICKGHNDCKTANNACAGQGECKGQGGFVAAPVKGCADIGGEIKDDWRGSVASSELVHCYGVNICKGHNDCKTAANACAGQGACKGQGGFVALTSKSCTDTGGKAGA